MSIGFFDSGMGGITVLKEALKLLPDEDYIYYADTRHVPYGEKSKTEVRQHILEAAEIIADLGVKALVVACNTATSIAIKDLRAKYSFPVIGMEPAVKPAVSHNKTSGKRVLVFATSLTLAETKFHDLVTAVDRDNIVDCLPLPELVIYAENMQFDSEVIIPCLRRKLSGYDIENYGTIVLGCTHFPLFLDSFRRIFPENVEIIDGAAGTIKHLSHILHQTGNMGMGRGNVSFYSSGNNAKDRIKFYQLLSYVLPEPKKIIYSAD